MASYGDMANDGHDYPMMAMTTRSRLGPSPTSYLLDKSL